MGETSEGNAAFPNYDSEDEWDEFQLYLEQEEEKESLSNKKQAGNVILTVDSMTMDTDESIDFERNANATFIVANTDESIVKIVVKDLLVMVEKESMSKIPGILPPCDCKMK